MRLECPGGLNNGEGFFIAAFRPVVASVFHPFPKPSAFGMIQD
jgi:hypothetical protein